MISGYVKVRRRKKKTILFIFFFFFVYLKRLSVYILAVALKSNSACLNPFSHKRMGFCLSIIGISFVNL